MLWFNRKEVYFGYSLDMYSKIRDILSENKISYDIKVLNNLGHTERGRSGSFGMKQSHPYQYYIYVKSNDYDEATRLLKNIN